jgi:disulfide bond formation protein DsbB
LHAIRSFLWGYELWAAFLVAAIATGGSLFFSEIAGFVPCELCWYQRICMYPLSLLTLFAAAHRDYRFARYLLPLPIVGAGVSIYHLLIENAVIKEPSACQIGGAGCAVKWINEFGYITIPTLALTGFALLIVFLGLAAAESEEGVATLEGDG